MSSRDRRPAAVVFGLAGPALLPEERAFFARTDPLGFILFERNCADPAQIRKLTAELRACAGRPDAPILIDQEGGRVQRLKPPHWPSLPPAAAIGAVARRDADRGREAARVLGSLIAAELSSVGVTVDCAPVLDVPARGSHKIIGDRAFSDDPERVADLGRAFCDGMLDAGVIPVIKHIPGHGRARVDSHEDLPVVDVHRGTLEAIDFAPFRALHDMPWAMTAHVVYRAFDSARPATISPKVISEAIRKMIGFDGVLISDDLSMKALGGSLKERAEGALAAGCDVALHCNGNMAEMEDVAAGCRPLDDAAVARIARGAAWAAKGRSGDYNALVARLDDLLGGQRAAG